MNFELIVVSNGAHYDIDSTLGPHRPAYIKVLHLRKNLHLCRAINRAAALVDGSIIGVVNDDVTIDTNWTAAVAETFRTNQGIGSVASIVRQHRHPTLLDSAGNHLSIDGCAFNRQWGEPFQSAPKIRKLVFGPSNACAAYRRDAFFHAGGLDEEFDAYYEDIDLSFRMHLLGYEAILSPECAATHIGSATFKKEEKSYLMERNYVWNLIKNLPTKLWQRHRTRILNRLVRPLPLGGIESRAAWQKGKMVAIARAKSMLVKRKHIQQSTIVSIASIEQLLTSESSSACRL